MKTNQLLYVIFIFLFTNYSIFAQQQIDETLTYDGEIRQYTIYIPATYQSTEAAPLMFNFHGGGGGIQDQIYVSDMRALAELNGFILVYPQALSDPNDGGSTNWLHKEPTDVDDVFFIDELITTISAQYSINGNRIYACGYSLGGEFTYELACRLNEKIAAVGVVARTMGTAAFDNCAPLHPTGILTILGTDDAISPYEGLTWGGIQYYLSADETHEYWASYNNTDSNPVITDLPNTNPSDGSTVERHVWSNGDACVTVEHLKVLGGDHDWPGTFGNMDINSNEEIWNFVSQFDLYGLIDCMPNTVESNLDNTVKIDVYPNPVVNTITIELENRVSQEFKIYSTTSDIVMEGKINSNIQSIDVSSLPSNVYFISLNNQTIRFLKL